MRALWLFVALTSCEEADATDAGRHLVGVHHVHAADEAHVPVHAPVVEHPVIIHEYVHPSFGVHAR